MVDDTVAQRLSMLEKRHRDLKDRVSKLKRRAYLTPSEQKQIADLKKLKLNAKDELHALRRQI